jgi:hypothetical protein
LFTGKMLLSTTSLGKMLMRWCFASRLLLSHSRLFNDEIALFYIYCSLIFTLHSIAALRHLLFATLTALRCFLCPICSISRCSETFDSRNAKGEIQSSSDLSIRARQWRDTTPSGAQQRSPSPCARELCHLLQA